MIFIIYLDIKRIDLTITLAQRFIFLDRTFFIIQKEIFQLIKLTRISTADFFIILILLQDLF